MLINGKNRAFDILEQINEFVKTDRLAHTDRILRLKLRGRKSATRPWWQSRKLGQQRRDGLYHDAKLAIRSFASSFIQNSAPKIPVISRASLIHSLHIYDTADLTTPSVHAEHRVFLLERKFLAGLKLRQRSRPLRPEVLSLPYISVAPSRRHMVPYLCFSIAIYVNLSLHFQSRPMIGNI